MERSLLKLILFFVFLSGAGFSLAADPDMGGKLTLGAELSDDGETIGFPFSVSSGFYYNTSITEKLGFSGALDLGWRESDLFDGEAEETSGPLFIYIVNPSTLSFQYKGGVFNLKAGRFAFTEPSGQVFTQAADGFVIGIPSEPLSFSIFGCYTGFQWKNKSAVVMSLLDEFFSAQEDTVFSAPRLVFSGAALLNYAGSHSLYLSLLTQKDLRLDTPEELLIQSGDPRETTAVGSLVDTNYFNLGFDGRFSTWFAYSLFGVLETGNELYCPREGELADTYTGGSILAFCAGGSFKFFPAFLPGTMIQLEGVYSSGDKDKNSVYEGNLEGSDNAYLPVTIVSTGKVLPIQLGNTWYLDLTCALFPLSGSRSFVLRDSMLIAQLRSHFRSTVGPVSVYGIDSESLSPYLGTETGLTYSMKFFSDLSLAAVFGVFFPGLHPNGAFEAEYYSSRPAVFSASLSLTQTF